MSNNEETVRILLTEYQVCTNKAHSYSTVMWQTGAIFIAGSIILLGAIISKWGEVHPLLHLLSASVGVGTLFLWWILYNRYRWYVNLCLCRARAIEKYLNETPNITAVNEISVDKIPTKMIETWITSMDHKKDWDKYVKWLSEDIQNPPWFGRRFMIGFVIGFILVFFFIIGWLIGLLS